MGQHITTVLAFLVALSLLIAVHEYGHYRMALACRVKVLRFSIGFGKVLLRWQPKGSATEFVVGALPLGGYVRMLDEREGPVAPGERHLAFNRRPLSARAAIVFAGPLANLLLAVLLYAGAAWIGALEPAPLLASPVPNSLAAKAGLVGGERVRQAQVAGEEPQALKSFEALRWLLLRSALNGESVTLEFDPPGSARPQKASLDLSSLDVREVDANLVRAIGILGPYTQPVLGEVLAGGAAERAGLLAGDLVLEVDAQAIVDGAQMREVIRASVRKGAARQLWRVQRAGATLQVEVRPDAVSEAGAMVGRIGAMVGGAPEMVLVRRGFLDGLALGLHRTVEVSELTLRMMGRMVVGQASLRNLSGPLTIADYAGKSARFGVVAYLVFLALISVSLGVLNLLPLPMLDGGHLMYYLWEALTGKAVADAWMERLQRGGAALLVLMMSVAIYNDVTRLLWG
jgi:regulator of sigma E protease